MAFVIFGGVGLVVGCIVAAAMRDRALWAAGVGVAVCATGLVFVAAFGGGEGSTVEKPVTYIVALANLVGWLLGVAAVVAVRSARHAQRGA